MGYTVIAQTGAYTVAQTQSDPRGNFVLQAAGGVTRWYRFEADALQAAEYYNRGGIVR